MSDQHFPLCPCGRCQQIRAARPDPPVPLAYLPCCGATVKLTRGRPGQYGGFEKHSAHCEHAGAFLLPETKETT